jgi:hypothetical protein
MERKEIVAGFVQLGKLMSALGHSGTWNDYSLGVSEREYNELQELIKRQKQFNGWFTEESVCRSLTALGEQLSGSTLNNWLAPYRFSNDPKMVAIIMAGNIPLVGFHDMLCVLLSGNTAVCKLSSDDRTLLPALGRVLSDFVPGLEDRLVFTEGKIGEVHAVIATGSDNSTLYFEQYFGKYPHIFRSNRTSLAVLKGDETPEELRLLGNDIFHYFGLGCRNVSHIMVPEGFDLNRIFEAVYPFGEIIHHHKYANNYDYNRAVFLLNQVPFLDNHFVMLRESSDLFSPLAVVHYQYYRSGTEISEYLTLNESKIQAIIGKGFIPFGQAQCPTLADYADGVDTMEFLTRL